MKAENSGFKCLFRYTVILSSLLFMVLIQTTDIKAQKLPPIFSNSSTDPSAFNLESIKAIKDEYDRKVKSTTDTDREQARQLRNRLIGIGREQVDAMFISYLRNDRKKRQLFQFLLDFLEIGAATAISLTNGERGKTIISEGLGALQASRTSLNKNFQLLERQVLINKMAADRATILTDILSKRDRDVTQYSWEDARADLRAYRDAGTLDAALSSLSSSVGKEKTDAEARLREVKDQPLTSAATEDDLQAAADAAPVRETLRTKLQDDTTKEAALKTLQKIVERLGEDKEIAKLLKVKGLSPTTDNGEEILNALRDLREELTAINRRDLVKKINLITAEVGNQ
ncbi:MAG TPA: hypothetical protein VGB17_04265 [Pyrinomonadaceae bacterium]|jgi:hypothetical protein